MASRLEVMERMLDRGQGKANIVTDTDRPRERLLHRAWYGSQSNGFNESRTGWDGTLESGDPRIG